MRKLENYTPTRFMAADSTYNKQMADYAVNFIEWQRVTVDRKTGAVTFESSVLFDTGKNEIKDAGKAALNSCIPVYICLLYTSRCV